MRVAAKRHFARRRLVVVAALVAVTAAVPGRATATGVFADADVFPDGNLGACATISFSTEQRLIVGELSVVGSEPLASTRSVGAEEIFFDVTPVFTRERDAWSGCVNGAQETIRYGSATYTLNATGSDGGEVVLVLKCVVVDGHMTCGGL
ncbi:MAG TPA: hypothetical protein VHJ76_07565 [Actinomycetota bacterium]|nr:hypothetical protein [Actinomycetota bacterium]